MKVRIFILSLTTVFFSSCYYDNEEYLYGVEECGPTEVSYSDQIEPIIMDNCSTSGCHSDVQSPVFTDYNSISTYADRIQIRTGNGTMPPNGELTSDEIQLIKCWVDQGAKDN